MHEFHVDARQYYEVVGDVRSPNGYAVNQNIASTERAMCQLIERYDLQRKEILSLGPRFGHEEFWLLRADCKVVLIDIDELGDIQPNLQKCSPGADLTFIIGDAFEWLTRSTQQFNVIYTAGFGPQEIRRADLQSRGEWSDSTPFYHPELLPLCSAHLRPNGLYINLSYYAGPALDNASVLLRNMAAQLDASGLHLAEVYVISSNPGIHLDVASTANADEFRRTIACRPPIERIHGRAVVDDPTVVRIYPEGVERSCAPSS